MTALTVTDTERFSFSADMLYEQHLREAMRYADLGMEVSEAWDTSGGVYTSLVAGFWVSWEEILAHLEGELFDALIDHQDAHGGLSYRVERREVDGWEVDFWVEIEYPLDN